MTEIHCPKKCQILWKTTSCLPRLLLMLRSSGCHVKVKDQLIRRTLALMAPLNITAWLKNRVSLEISSHTQEQSTTYNHSLQSNLLISLVSLSKKFADFRLNAFNCLVLAGVLVNIECKVWSPSINHHLFERKDRKGAVHFEILIDDPPKVKKN